MNIKISKFTYIALLFALVLLVLPGMSYAAAVDVYLRAETTTVTMPDTTVVPVWGFAECDSSFTTCGAATVPGPRINAVEGDSLTIHVNNTLQSPVSIVMPGQITAMTPVWVDIADPYGAPTGTGSRPALDTTSRVRSFTHETAPATTNTYTWASVKPGTYIYESGTHPALQVQMGLYGALTVTTAGGEAYAGVPFDTEVMVFYSEIDPVFHSSVTDTNPPTYPPTNVYHPRYFMVNGMPYAIGDPAVPAGTVGQNVLIRFFNAGLDTHMPMVKGSDVKLIAEDGYPKPFVRDSYSINLPAGKTADAIFTPAQYGTYVLFDRRLYLANSMQSPGGLITILSVGSSGLTDVGVVRGNRWYQDNNGNRVFDNGSDSTFKFGLPGDVFITGDWNGDGVTEVASVRGNRWYVDMNGNGVWESAGPDVTFKFGILGDIPVSGDWNGDGITDIGGYRPSNNRWYLDLNGDHVWTFGLDKSYGFGMVGTPVSGDWNGDGFTDIGIYVSGTWYLDADGDKTWNPAVDATYVFNPGFPTALPVTGDWDGNGTSEIGIFLDGTWYLDSNGSGTWQPGLDETFNFGFAADLPVTGIW